MKGISILWDQDKIKKMRLMLGISQNKFGALLGVGNMTVYHWEKGNKKPAPKQIELLNKLELEYLK